MAPAGAIRIGGGIGRLPHPANGAIRAAMLKRILTEQKSRRSMSVGHAIDGLVLAAEDGYRDFGGVI